MFNYYKDDISRKLLLRVNTIQQGELKFENISLNPFIQFPNVSLALNTVNYFEHPVKDRLIDTIPIIELDDLFLTFDILDLLKGDVNLSTILLQNGKVNLITYADSSLNLVNAFGLVKDTVNIEQDTIDVESYDFELNLDLLKLRNIDVNYKYLPDNSYGNYKIPLFDASLQYLPDTISLYVSSNIKLENLLTSNIMFLRNKNIQLETEMAFCRDSKMLKVEPSKLSIEGANFEIVGSIDLANEGFIDLNVSGDDNDFSVFNLFLTNTGIDNIRSGNLFFNASIKGSLIGGIPFIDCTFGMNDVNIKIPDVDDHISELSLNGHFISGKDKDLSGASLSVEKIKAKLPGGSLEASFSLKDFRAPVFDMECYLTANITGFEKVFNLGMIDSLSGNLEVKTEIHGKYDLANNKILEEEDVSYIRFDDVYMDISEFHQIQHLNGLLSFGSDTIHFNDLALEIGNSDFIVNGILRNPEYLITNVEENIEGEFKIQSQVYDLPDFFISDPRVGNSFPYRIKDIDLDFSVSTTVGKLSNFVMAPDIEFDIHQLKAEIENYLPPINIIKGMFNLGDADSSLNLDFSDFDIDMAGSKLYADVIYNSPWVDPDWLKVDLLASNINPQKTFEYWFSDTLPEYLNARLDGEMHLDLILSLDSIDFDKLDFKAENLKFVNSVDTFDIFQMRFNALDVNYSQTNSSNILKYLDAKIDLTINKMYSNHFNVNDLDYKIDVEKGEFRIQPRKYQFFNQTGEGYYVLRPFDEIPSYELKYKVQQFDIGPLFSTFLTDTILSGKMDLDIEFQFQGAEVEMIKKTLQGKLVFGGKDLTFYGLDLDKVIDRFKRSQHFTFADVGAVLLMGPAGILVTKGSDFASIIVLNPGESSKVVEISSEWELQDGLVNLSDVAFTTIENRMAAKGWINIMTDSLDINIALLNESGCSLYLQGISGPRKDPDIGKVKVMKSLFAPVTNLVKGDCEVFYDGKVKQPGKK